MIRGREPDEDAVRGLGDGVRLVDLATFEPAASHGRYAHDLAIAVDRHTVIPASDIGVDDAPERQSRAAMRTAVLDAAHAAVFAAPQHEVPCERLDRAHLADPHFGGFRDDVPAARQTLVE